MDIIVTVPKSTNWSDYEKELEAAANGAILNFKVRNYPKQTKVGSKCYICYDGNIIGYHIVCGMKEHAFTCETTGREWQGKFIQRTGAFQPIEAIPMKGFQGYRYFKPKPKK